MRLSCMRMGALVSFTAGIVFALHGAWPVLGFFGIDVLALYIAFRVSYRAGRLIETVQIDADEVRLARVQPNGKRREWTFAPYWLQVIDEQPDGRNGHLLLRSHGRSVRFASFLSPAERAGLAGEIRDTLRRLREADALQGAGGGELFTSKADGAFADQRTGQMRQRRQIARGANRTLRRNHRQRVIGEQR